MHAWTRSGESPAALALGTVARPMPLPHEALVRVEAFAPNPADLAALPATPPGAVPGWDGAGTVVQAAANGQGPREGDRVIFLGRGGGWAQERTVSVSMVGRAPDDAPWERLAALPIPATSALRAVRRLGSILGRRILIGGASSAVGVVAVQLAARSGAEVVAVARDPEQHGMLRGLGAQETHTSVEQVRDRVHGAIDMVGGQQLVGAYALLEPGGTVIALGHAAGADEHFPYGAFVADETTADRAITSFFLGAETDLSAEMAYLSAQTEIELGALDLHPWTELAEWIEAGAPRRNGRVVFRVDHGAGAPGRARGRADR